MTDQPRLACWHCGIFLVDGLCETRGCPRSELDLLRARVERVEREREPSQDEGDAKEHATAWGCFVARGEWYGRRCSKCGRWVWRKDRTDEVVLCDRC